MPKYSDEFKSSVVARSYKIGVEKTSKEMLVPVSSISNWRKQHKEDKKPVENEKISDQSVAEKNGSNGNIDEFNEMKMKLLIEQNNFLVNMNSILKDGMELLERTLKDTIEKYSLHGRIPIEYDEKSSQHSVQDME